MKIKAVTLRDFRNYEEMTLELSDGINILYGKNAQGKTNFVEAVYFAACGRSHRTGFDKEMIRFGERIAGIRVVVEKGMIMDKIDVNIKKEGKKAVAVNGVAVKKLSELFGVLYAVIFSPEDLGLVSEGPSIRRRFIDAEICQLSAVYYHDLSQYIKILKQRNALLKEIIKKRTSADTLFMWDEQLVFHGKKIMDGRKKFINKLNQMAMNIHEKITDRRETLNIEYKKNVESDEFLEKLKKGRERDIALGATSVGVHKDDIIFSLNGIDARAFASQGQKRTISLALKMAEIELIKTETGEKPVLLLDDVFSELDKHRQNALLEGIEGVQTIITCTGINAINYGMFNSDGVKVYSVEKGNIFSENGVL